MTYRPKDFVHGAALDKKEEERFSPRDPESMDPYGPQNHPLPPFKPREEK